MRRITELEKQLRQIDSIVDLSGAFEGIASLRIAQIKNQVLQSQDFFAELWRLYKQIDPGETVQFGQQVDDKDKLDRDLMIVITAEGGLSGDIDAKLIELMMQAYNPHEQDIIAIGRHGVVQLAHHNIPVKTYYKLPVHDQNINVSPIVAEVRRYRSTTAYYQTYLSLGVQDVKRISLRAALAERMSGLIKNQETISERNYIFEPSVYDVIEHLESSMTGIALSQIILESKLAQYASRFRAMSAAHDKAKDSFGDLTGRLNRARRNQRDERLKEIINGVHKTRRLI